MTDDELLQATLIALTKQNVTVGGGGGKPKEVTIGFIEMIFDTQIWVGERITDEFHVVN